MAGCWTAEHGGHFNLWWTGKSMLCCFILFKRCRTCRSQLRCWTCGRRGTFSISWGWRARSKDSGQSSGRLNRTGRRSSTKTFRYIFVWSLNLWRRKRCGEKKSDQYRSRKTKSVSGADGLYRVCTRKNSWFYSWGTTTKPQRWAILRKRKTIKLSVGQFFLDKQNLGINWTFELYDKERSVLESRYNQPWN